MKSLRSSLIYLVTLTALMTAGLLAFCWHHGVWSWRDWEIYRCMEHECHPVWRDLHAGRIRVGDDVDQVIERTNPAWVEEFENVKILCYKGRGLAFTGVTITAKDGRLMSAMAWSCTWERRFFDTWDRDEMVAFNRRHSAHLNAKRQARFIDELIAEARWPLIVVFP